MNDLEKNLRDSLLEAEQTTPTLKDKYQQELNMLINHELTRETRKSLLLNVAGCILIGIICISMATVAARSLGLSRTFRVLLAISTIFLFLRAALLVRLLRRGRMNLKTDIAWQMRLAWILAFTAFFFIMGESVSDPDEAIFSLIGGLAVLCIAAVQQIRVDIGQAQLQTREKLLKLECQFAELAEQIQRPPK